MRTTIYGSVLADTSAGRVVGFTDNDGLKIFRGIPYAAPPFGKHRFAAPAPVEPWTGERDATCFGPSTYQIEPLFRGHTFNYRHIMSPGWRPGDETLNLNIWTPAGTGDRLPVMVYIHGGAFLTGNGGLPAYECNRLAQRGAVCVTINYRTGTEGFACFAGAASNRGLRDQIAALQWVHDNIDEFGGDPQRVTVFGESAGGMSIALLMTSPAADGLFQRAIVQSGSGPRATTAEQAGEYGERIASALGVGNSVDELAAIDQKTMLDTALQALASPPRNDWSTMTTLGPWIDDDLLLPGLSLTDRPQRSTLWGTNRDEGNLFMATPDSMATTTEQQLDDFLRTSHGDVEPLRGLFAERVGTDEPGVLLAQHLNWSIFTGATMDAVDTLAADGRPTWLYRFDYGSRAQEGRPAAAHMTEFPFVFDHLDDPHHRAMTGPNPPQTLADEIASTWVGFASGVNPGWPAYTTAEGTGHIFDETSYDVPGLDRELWQVWSKRTTS